MCVTKGRIGRLRHIVAERVQETVFCGLTVFDLGKKVGSELIHVRRSVGISSPILEKYGLFGRVFFEWGLEP